MEINIKKRMLRFIFAGVILSLTYSFLQGDSSVFVGNFTSESSGKYVAITFDDGPKAGTTDVLLDGLKERGVRATFFLIGKQIDENRDIVVRMAAEGHQIGNHTFNHVNLAQMSDAGACEELTLCYEEIFSAVGAGEGSEGEAYFAIRPPFGEIGASVRENVDSPVILWSVDTRDWTGMGAEDIADYIVKTAGEGDIILLHDIFENSVAGALMAIDTMMENGYTFVTVDEMFENKGISLEPGKVYKKASP
ncbi:peptidoglycan/xylan/chitin deacetylase (PgdA/CDA1 family) [Catenibacillus scindens]|uniref:Peptidoglycan/xylan/chitin deacetylase (PgdA/CDA1 family) n=1 Tax=Catenibacillus scindens TaxID=673271 RepID=A0A7W8M453_9FIRM|nr:polysaccharide deacetylase family protein [Catenibacillus scindens]MBB5262931.1 peptidoglycan/xylan/chitin deacetylase (PgdA/CDA1 family) [Catenibacillus scindens]